MTNLVVIYKKVKGRESHAKDYDKYSAAKSATHKAWQILEKPTLKNVKEFRKAELEWMKYSNSRVSFADQFEQAIRAKIFSVVWPEIKTYDLGWDPPWGSVYVMWFEDDPYLVKVGATKDDLSKRLRLLVSKYKLSGKIIAFGQECEYPARIEHEMSNRLGGFRDRSPYPGNSLEWYSINSSSVTDLLYKLCMEFGYEMGVTTCLFREYETVRSP